MNHTIILFLLFLNISCTASSADLNKMAQDSLIINGELKEQASVLNSKFIGSDKATIITALGKPKKKSFEPYPYRLDLNCQGNNCKRGYSDEIWFYEFKRKFTSGWEGYSVYVYFKEGKVVRIK